MVQEKENAAQAAGEGKSDRHWKRELEHGCVVSQRPVENTGVAIVSGAYLAAGRRESGCVSEGRDGVQCQLVPTPYDLVSAVGDSVHLTAIQLNTWELLAVKNATPSPFKH
jgi:hypothetical protein